MRKSLIMSGASALALVGASAPAYASSHREAPGITEMPKVDNTDVYAFRSYEPGRDQFVTLISNFQPGENPGDGPNYYTMDPDAIYEIHVDNTGDAVEDLTYQFKFTNTLKGDLGKTLTVGGKTQPIAIRHIGPISAPADGNLGEDETYTVTQVTGNRRSGTRAAVTGPATFFKPFDNAGNKSVPNYPAYGAKFIYNATFPGCSTQGRVFVGQRAEYFAVNLGPIFDLVNFVPIQGSSEPTYNAAPYAGQAPLLPNGFPGGITQSQDNQELIGKKNVTSIAVEVPIACLTGTGNGVIGVWSTASLPQAKLNKPNPTYKAPALYGGAYTQVSRLGMPLVNEVVIGLPDKDLFNAAKPTQDMALAAYVTHPTFPAILDALFRAPVNATLGTNFTNLAPTNFPRTDLVATFLTGIATLNQLKTVTGSEMLRLNTGVSAVAKGSQNPLGVIAGDIAGFPNGRRPGDDVVDVVLRVAMGRLCHPVPIGTNGAGVQLPYCTPDQAQTGLVPYTDGAPSNSAGVQDVFPYLNSPLRGAPRPQNQP